MIRLSDSSSRRTVRILAGVCLLAVAYLCTYSRWWMLGFLVIAMVIAMNSERKRAKQDGIKPYLRTVTVTHSGPTVITFPPGAREEKIHRVVGWSDDGVPTLEPMYPNVVTIALREGFKPANDRAVNPPISRYTTDNNPWSDDCETDPAPRGAA